MPKELSNSAIEKKKKANVIVLIPKRGCYELKLLIIRDDKEQKQSVMVISPEYIQTHSDTNTIPSLAGVKIN